MAVIAGVLLWSRDWEIVRLASTKQKEDLFGLFAFCVFAALTYILYLEIGPGPDRSPQKIILVGLPYLVGLIFLAQTTELSFGSWDYEQYETAFRAVAAGISPYQDTRYLYPPLFAEMMAFVSRIGVRLFSYLGMDKSPWVFVFYIHQASLLFFLLLSYLMSIKFSVQLGLEELYAVLLTSAIYLLNVPILRTLSNNQVNFYILTSVLAVFLLVWRYPFAAGVATALGGLIKLYPFALSAPLFFMKKWKALAGILVGTAAVIFLETDFFRDFELWKQFFNFYLSFPVEQESLLFRNSSPMSFLRSTLGLLGLPTSMLRIVFIVVVAVILIWFSLRFFQREKINLGTTLTMDMISFRGLGHLLDFSVISLLIAPSAWEHHYVIAIPLGIWAFVMRGNDAFLITFIAAVLTFAMPVYNIYPFSYLRMVGLIMLLILTSPKNIEKAASVSSA
jgi:hypothetical protein